MRVWLDTNIILDYFLERDPFMNDAEALFAQIEAKQINEIKTPVSCPEKGETGLVTQTIDNDQQVA